ncbi:MAG: LysR family transcriptional regulator [Acidimicrobiales bacterium]
MTPNQLRTFVAVADAGSVREAAERLYVSQPAVSTVLAGLQADLAVKLVEREGRGLRLTPAGQVLAGYGRRLLGLWDEARVATVARADPEQGRLRLAAVTTAGEYVVPPLLASFRRLHPGVEVILEVGNRRRLWDLLEHGGADLGVGGRPPLGGRLVTRAVADNELVVVSAPAGDAAGEAAAGGSRDGPGGFRNGPGGSRDGPGGSRDGPGGSRDVSVGQLAGRTWLVREPGSGTRSTADELLDELGISPARLTLGSNGAIRESAIVGLGIALVSRAAVERELEEGSLEEWRAAPLPMRRSWHLVARGGEDLPDTAALFADHMLGVGVGVGVGGRSAWVGRSGS